MPDHPNIDFRSLDGCPLYAWDNETHELLDVIEPGQWFSATDIPRDRPVTINSSPEWCGCGCDRAGETVRG